MQFLGDTGYKRANSAISRGRKLATIKGTVAKWSFSENLENSVDDRGIPNLPFGGISQQSLKSFFKYLVAEGKVRTNSAEQVKMPKVQRKEPSYLTEQEYKRLLRGVKNNVTRYFKQRDMAIVTTLLGMGLRLSELVQLNVGDVNFEEGNVKVTRKGNQERILPANDSVMITIQRYLKTRKQVNAHDLKGKINSIVKA